MQILRDPVAWILVIAGIVEIMSGGTVARGAILFAGAGLIVADRVRSSRIPVMAGVGPAPGTGTAKASIQSNDLQLAMESPGWTSLAVLAVLVVALFTSHTAPVTVTVGLVGVMAVGWAWLTVPDFPSVAQPAARGLLVWGGVFLAFGLWELNALLSQPSLSEASNEYPTISHLLDPILETYPGRAITLALWAWAGRALVRKA